MKHTKQIAALAAVIFLAGLYILALIFALIDSPWAFEYLKITIGLTILIPVLLWIYLAMFRFLKERRQSAENETMLSDDKQNGGTL